MCALKRRTASQISDASNNKCVQRQVQAHFALAFPVVAGCEHVDWPDLVNCGRIYGPGRVWYLYALVNGSSNDNASDR